MFMTKFLFLLQETFSSQCSSSNFKEKGNLNLCSSRQQPEKRKSADYQDGGGAAVGDLEGEVPCGVVGVGPCHADVGADPGGDDDEARVAGAERGVVPDVEVEERDV